MMFLIIVIFNSPGILDNSIYGACQFGADGNKLIMYPKPVFPSAAAILAPTSTCQGPLPEKIGASHGGSHARSRGSLPFSPHAYLLNTTCQVIDVPCNSRWGKPGSYVTIPLRYKETFPMIHSTTYDAFFGMDVHQATITIAICLPNDPNPKHTDTINNRKGSIEKFFKKQLQSYPRILTAYEAGGCGFEIHRTLEAMGIDNQIIAPTHIPKRTGHRVKNDKNDAIMLAEFLRNGQLTPIHVPTHETLEYRELTRMRDDVTKAKVQAQNHVCGMLRSYDKKFTGTKTLWTQVFRKWLGTVTLPTTGLQMILTNRIEEVVRQEKRLAEINKAIDEALDKWPRQNVVRALMTLRGISLFTAMSIVAEVESFSRFDSAKKFMSYIGVTPSEFSSGERIGKNKVDPKRIKGGPITKAGNARIRRLLVEASWKGGQIPRQIGSETSKRWKGQPEAITEHAFKAQKRLFVKHQQMFHAGKAKPLITVALARELAGFVWAIGKMAEESA